MAAKRLARILTAEQRELLRHKLYARSEIASGCWEWTGQVDRHGYGILDLQRKHNLAHRLSWEVHYCKNPGDNLVCHRCDNRLCINPAHLFLGNNYSNTRDMILKGRRKSGSPELMGYRAKAAWSDPAFKARMSAIQTARQSSPEAKERIALKSKQVWADRKKAALEAKDAAHSDES